MSVPAVSVCVRAYARPDDLRAAIRSVLAQTFGDFELIVSDDSAGLESVCLESGDPRVSYHRNPGPRGPVGNLRHAVGLARGGIIAVLDEDDTWLPAFLTTTVGRLRADARTGVVFTDCFLDVGGRRTRRRLALPTGPQDRFAARVLDHSIPPSTAILRREVWDDGERALPLEPGMVADWTVWLRAADAGWRFDYVDEPLAVYRLHPGQMSWNEALLPTRQIATLQAFRFEDPAAERLRRARLAEAHLKRLGANLRRGRVRGGMADLRAARSAAPGRLGVRGLLAFSGARSTAMRWGSRHPRLIGPARVVWRRLRPSVGGRG